MRKMNNSGRCLLVILVMVGTLEMFNFCGADLTDDFTLVPLTESNFELQKPYDIPLDQRYSFVNGVHHLWVYGDDKPHDPSSHTQPRTEIRIKVICMHEFRFLFMLINSKSIKQLLPFVGAWLFKWSLAIWRLWLCTKWNIWCYSSTDSWCSSWCHHFDTKNLWWGHEVLQ